MMKKLNETGWVEKEVPECGPLDAIVRPTCVSPCTSDIHTVWEGAIGDRKDNPQRKLERKRRLLPM